MTVKILKLRVCMKIRCRIFPEILPKTKHFAKHKKKEKIFMNSLNQTRKVKNCTVRRWSIHAARVTLSLGGRVAITPTFLFLWKKRRRAGGVFQADPLGIFRALGIRNYPNLLLLPALGRTFN